MPMNFQQSFPLTHDHAVRYLMGNDWDPAEKRELSRASADRLLHGFSKAFRQHWHLDEITSPFRRYYMRHFGVGHPEDISRLVVEDFLCRWQRRDFDMGRRLEELRQKWIQQGIDPITLEKVQR